MYVFTLSLPEDECLRLLQFSTSSLECAFIVVGFFNLLLPTSPPPIDAPKLQPSYYLPSTSKPVNIDHIPNSI